jgi:hypothetical protein
VVVLGYWAKKLRVVLFYLPASLNFLRCFFDPRLTLRFGHYVLFSGEKLPYFFLAKEIPISSVTLLGNPIHQTVQYKRVQEVLATYPQKPGATKLHGRATDRIFALVEARLTGNDEFVVLLERLSPRRYAIIDGGTRSAVLASTGATSLRAYITLRGESRFW